MADLLQDGADWLSAKRHQYLTRLMRIRRGSQSALISVTVGPIKVEAPVEIDLQLIIGMKDFVVRKIDYAFDLFVPVEPQRNDLIEDFERDEVYTVLPIIGESVCREVQQGNDWRIHAKKTS